MHDDTATESAPGPAGSAPAPIRADPVVRAVRAVLAPLSRTRLFRSAAPRALPVVERIVAALSGGRAQLSGLLVPSLVLHTLGARSALPRAVPLMYTPDGLGRAIVAGTSYARERHPGWTVNLAACPEAWITVRGRGLRVVAEPIRGEAREAAWRRIESQWPGYRGYERDSGRRVRLFLLRPVPGGPPGWLSAPVAAGGAPE